MADKTIPFDFIQCSSKYIEKIRLEEEDKIAKIKNEEKYDPNTGIQEGPLYFVLDTKQILLGKIIQKYDKELNKEFPEGTLVPMGSGTGVRFAKKENIVSNLNPRVHFDLTDLEDDSCYPQIDDLIFNSDGCFYRVGGTDAAGRIIADRLTVAGSGGGGGSGSSSGGNFVGSSETVSYKFPKTDVKTIPSCVVYKSTGTFTAKNFVEFKRDGVKDTTENSIKQTIYIDGKKKGESWITPWVDNIITFENSWFETEATNAIQISYKYGTTQAYTIDFYPKGVKAIDLAINENKFKNTNIKETITNNKLVYEGSVSDVLSDVDYDQRIYIKISPLNSNTYIPIKTFGFTAAENGYYYFQVTNKSFITNISELPFGMYTFKSYQTVTLKSGNQATLTGTENTYHFIVGDDKKIPEETDVLFLCDLSNIDNKTFKDIDEISIPMMIHIPGEDNYQKPVNVSVYYEANGVTKPPAFINSDENIIFSLRRLPVYLDENEKELSYKIKIFLTDYPGMEYEFTVTILKTVAIDSNIIEWLELNAENRNNNEASRDIWENVSVSNNASETAYGKLENFTWATGGSGWTSQALRLRGDAKVTIKDFNPFASTDKTNNIPDAGRSFLFHFNVTNFTRRTNLEHPIIKCISKVTGGEFGIKIFGDIVEFVNPSMIGGLRMGYMNGEEVHLAICISPVNTADTEGIEDEDVGSTRGLVEVYLNGVLSAARLYRSKDFPTDFENEFEFTIGNGEDSIDLYSINVFQGKLSSKEVVKYYISSLKDLNKAAKLKLENDIYEGEKLSIAKIKENTSVPVMIIKGELPGKKSDKLKTVTIEFHHPTDIGKSFTAGGFECPDPTSPTYNDDKKDYIPIEVQGTSSQYYPVKNWKIKKLKPIDENGKKYTYQIDESQIPTATYCLKADYAEATGTHNTQNANFIDFLYRSSALQNCKKSLPQILNPKTRTTIYGYPIVVFHQKTPESEIEFLGKYNFNFDKGSKEVFGFEQTFTDPDTGETRDVSIGECWEFCNNDDITGFKHGAFDTIRIDKNAKFAWNKWKVTYNSNLSGGTSREVYFPMDQSFVDSFPEEYEEYKEIFSPPEDGGLSYVPEGVSSLDEKCNSNYDYVKSLVYIYMNMMSKHPTSKEKLYNEALLSGDEELIKACKKQYDDAVEEANWWKQAQCSIDTMVPMWMEFFEARYCDRPLYDANGEVITYRSGTALDENNNPVAEYDDIYDISNFAKLYNWILDTGVPSGENINNIKHPVETTKTKGQVFKDDLNKYFDVESLKFYYLYTHFAIMADQRAKNMFFTYWYPLDENYNFISEVGEDGQDLPRSEIISKAKYGGYWTPWFYDNDTCFGINNTGYESFGYASEDDASDADSQVYQGEDSILWRNLKLVFDSELKVMYSNLREEGLTFKKMSEYFIDNSAEKWPLSIYNEDAQKKYIEHAYKKIVLSNDEEDETAEREEVIKNIRGNGVSRFKRFMTDRIDYCDMRWKNMGTNVLQLRPMNADGISETYSFTPFSSGFFGLYFGAYGLSAPNYFTKKARENVISEQPISASSGSNNVTYMVPPEHFLDLGDLSTFNLREFFGNFSRLETLQLGNKDKVPKYCKEKNGKYYNITGNIFKYKEEEIPLSQLDTNFDNFDVEQVNKMRSLKAAVKDASQRGCLQEKPNNFDGSISKCPSLKYLDISNVGFDTKNESDLPTDTNIIQSLSLLGSPNLRKVYARNARIRDLVFTEGGYLEELLLSDWLRSFIIQKQLLLTEEKVVFENCLVSDKNPYRNLESIIIEDCHNFDSKTFLLKCLDRRNDIQNYNIADKVLETGTPIEKVIRITNVDYEKEEDGKTPKVLETIDGKNVYSPWVFKNNTEFKTFVENLEYYLEHSDEAVLKAQLDNGKKVSNKIYLSGSCYILGDEEIDGGLKKRLQKINEGNFVVNTPSTATKYQVDFYYIDLETNQRVSIKRLGKPYFKTIDEGQTIGDPYLSSYTANGDYKAPDFNETGGLNYVPEYSDIEGYSYKHTPADGEHKWMVRPKGEPIPTRDELKAETDVLLNKPVEESLDVYAVPVAERVKYKVYVENKGTKVPGFDNYVEVYYGQTLNEALASKGYDLLPEKVTHPTNSEKYDFSRWVPSPNEKLYGNTTIQAMYNNISLQTVTLLNKTIEEIVITTDTIPDYRFYGCKNLIKVFLSDKNTSLGKNDSSSVFKNSAIYSNDEIRNGKPAQDYCSTLGKIYFPSKDIQDYYLTQNGWADYSDSFEIGKRGEV